MQESIRKYATQVLNKWNGIEKGLRIKMVIIALALIAALGITIFLTARPKWVVIVSNSDYQTIGQIQNAFEDAGIKNNTIKNGTGIEVQQKDVNKANLLIAEKNITTSGFRFADSLSANSMTMSASDKDEMYLRVRETEIADTISLIDGVESANVHLVLPNDTVLFDDGDKEASASVTVVTNKDLTKDQTLTIARLVSMSVQNLDMKNIEIADQNANSLYSGSSNDISSSSSREDIEQQKLRNLEMKVRSALVQLYDDVNIVSNLTFDWDKRQQKTNTYTPPVDEMTVGVPKTQTREQEDVVNGAEGEAPGTDANDQEPPNYAMGEENNATYSGSKETNDYLYNTNEVVIDSMGGTIIPEQSSMAVVVYRYREYDEDYLEKNGTIDRDNTWEDFKLANSQETAIDIAPELIDAIRVGTGLENVSLIGYEKPIFVDKVQKPLNTEQIIILAILAVLLVLLAYGLIKKTKPEDTEKVEPLELETIIGNAQKLEEEQQQQEQEAAAGLAEINEVESEYKRQIGKFIDEKPEAVANLLRNWLNDDWE